MAKININFNNTNYTIDGSTLSTATSALRTHLSTVMNGTGATINLGGTSYNVDSAKLSAATNAFVSHLGTINGNGSNVVVDGVKYGIDSAKVQNAVSELETVLGGFISEEVPVEKVAGLYRSGTNFTELIYTWDQLIENHMISVNESDYVTLYLYNNSEFVGDLIVTDGIESIPMDGGTGATINLTSIVLPLGFKYLGHCALGRSSTLTKVVIPTSVTTIAATAFSDSPNLTVYYAGSESQWNAIETEHMDCCMGEFDSCQFNRIPDGGIVYNYTFE